MMLNLVEGTWRERLKRNRRETGKNSGAKPGGGGIESSGKIKKYLETNWKEVEKAPILLN